MATSKIEKPLNQTLQHFTSANNYDLYVCQIGRIVVVSGQIYGSGRGEYLPGLGIPTSAAGNAIMRARCVSGTGAGNVIDVRQGSNGNGIYREASMANGSIWDISFAYLAAYEV